MGERYSTRSVSTLFFRPSIPMLYVERVPSQSISYRYNGTQRGEGARVTIANLQHGPDCVLVLRVSIVPGLTVTIQSTACETC